MRTRFAPSPTGLLHLGHAYAVLCAWHEAQEGKGEFLVRIEDIDFTRCRPNFEEAIFEDLEWLGLKWPLPVWRQSERMTTYRDALDRLQRLGVVYPCFCTRQEMASIDAPQGPEGPLYSGVCRGKSADERAELLAAQKPFALRLNVEKAKRLAGPVTWIDLDLGVVRATPELLGDVVIARKDIMTSYHLAVTVDDAAQNITVVTRGEDLLPSTHVHRLLQALLDLPVPVWRHHKLICDETGRRLAKRDDARSLRSLRLEGCSRTDIARLIGQKLP
ncbi:MAG TPA: tRNA glutamyl-Q(34) synthetase GluQRS [Verrucomicrobiales bacterium]|nr:tRNA glutamyl-Q(34) synthetase GluQRS [Verrucomicrobiales bacterium]